MEIRHLKAEEIPELRMFIHKYWKPNHILATSHELMKWQYYDEVNKRYNWIIYKDSDGIQVILGYIPTTHFDARIERVDIWLAIWKRSDKVLPRGTGTKLLDYLEDFHKPDTVAAIGINDLIEQLYLKRGWRSGIMNHYYFINPGKLISYPDGSVFVESELPSFYQFSPSKSMEYAKNRYLNHPFYDYRVFSIDEKLFIIGRVVKAKDGSCFRIVDTYHANELNRWISSDYSWHKLAQYLEVDYIDLMTNLSPLPGLNNSSRIRIPNWFEPFDPEPKPIKYAYKCDTHYTIHKGDSDQDRPSQL